MFTLIIKLTLIVYYRITYTIIHASQYSFIVPRQGFLCQFLFVMNKRNGSTYVGSPLALSVL